MDIFEKHKDLDNVFNIENFKYKNIIYCQQTRHHAVPAHGYEGYGLGYSASV